MTEFTYNYKVNKLFEQYLLNQFNIDYDLGLVCNRKNVDQNHLNTCAHHIEYRTKSKINHMKLQGNIWLLNRFLGIK